jgi:hypothetical protein
MAFCDVLIVTWVGGSVNLSLAKANYDLALYDTGFIYFDLLCLIVTGCSSCHPETK